MAPFVEPTFIQGAFWPDPAAVSPSALLGMHYQAHGCFLSPGQLLAGVETIRHLPATILSGSEDLMCPPSSAWALHLAWPQATFHQVPAAGHTAGALTMAERLIEATDELAALLAARQP
jgi:proline iminopeptidase